MFWEIITIVLIGWFIAWLIFKWKNHYQLNKLRRKYVESENKSRPVGIQSDFRRNGKSESREQGPYRDGEHERYKLLSDYSSQYPWDDKCKSEYDSPTSNYSTGEPQPGDGFGNRRGRGIHRGPGRRDGRGTRRGLGGGRGNGSPYKEEVQGQKEKKKITKLQRLLGKK